MNTFRQDLCYGVRFVALFLALLSTATSGGRGQAPDSLSTATRDVKSAEPEVFTYRKVGAQALKAYVFLPQTTGKARSAILLFHGGAWRLGEAGWLFGRAKEFAEKGMVAISVEYRLAVDGLSPIDGVEDTCAAFAWTRQQARKFGIDTKRVAGYGVSAGGHLVAAAAVLPSVNGKKIAMSSRPNALLMFSPALNMTGCDHRFGHGPLQAGLRLLFERFAAGRAGTSR